MMRPLFVCAAALVLAACSADVPMPDVFPENLAGWHRTGFRDLRAAEAPDPLPRSGIARIRTASYEGPGKLTARVYQMSSPAVALDAVQRWQTAADTVFFYSDRYFVVVQWETAERKPLQEFVAALEKKLSKPDARKT
jgi:hypothetical protein